MPLHPWNHLEITEPGYETVAQRRRLVEQIRMMQLTPGDGSVLIDYAGGNGVIRVRARRGGAAFDHPFKLKATVDAAGHPAIDVIYGRVWGMMEDGINGIPKIGGTSLEADPKPLLALGNAPVDGWHAVWIQVKCTYEGGITESPVIALIAPGGTDPEDTQCIDAPPGSEENGEYHHIIGRFKVADGLLVEPDQRVLGEINVNFCGCDQVYFTPAA